MKSRFLLTHTPFCLLALSMLVTSITEAAVNKIPIANADVDQVVGFSTSVLLNGKRSIDSDGTIKKYQWLQIQGTKVVLTGALTAKATFATPAKVKNQQPLTFAFKLIVTDNQNAITSDTVVITTVTGRLNDTGITTCSNGTKNGLACPIVGYPGQDAQSGRDASYNKDADGHAGFSFTKISDSGKVLAAKAKNWNCVQDNVTGLMWEAKTDDSGLHDKDWIYSWYEPDNTKNGGKVGFQKGGSCGNTSACDTYTYVKAVNSAGWCGAKDWRMPTKRELFSIINYGSGTPIDSAYFRNITDGIFWSSSPHANVDDLAHTVSVYSLSESVTGKEVSLPVRLVRSGR